MKDWGRTLLNLLLPPLCLACGRVVGQTGALCAPCWNQIAFLSGPACARCGHPFDLDMPPGTLCPRCLENEPTWNRAKAVFRYDDASKGLILRLKHADRPEGVPAFAGWMIRAAPDLVQDCQMVVPVPLHRWRLLARRYNQAALLAKAIADQSGKAFTPRALTRTRRTPPQGHLDRTARRANVKGAFACTGQVSGKAVLLIDDVMTTGATLDECARILIRAGASRVDVLTLGRVVLGG